MVTTTAIDPTGLAHNIIPQMALDRAARPELALDRGSVREIDKDSGHMHVAVSPISKANIRPYYGREIPRCAELGLDEKRVYNLLLHPDELAKGAATFTGKPLLIQHRPQIASDHDRDKVIGSVGEVEWAAPYLQSPLTIWDGEGINAIESGEMQELSAAFFYDPVMTGGTYEGQAYDGLMTNVRGNHVSIVPAGRAGPDVMVLDAKLKESPAMTKPLSRKAAAVRSSLLDYLPTRLAADAALDIRALVAPVTAANWATERPKIEFAIRGAKLAVDANLDDLKLALDAADDDEDEEAKKKIAEDEDDDDDDDAKPKTAMDQAAFDKAIQIASDAAEARAIKRMNDKQAAERAVLPYVGEVMGLDSAEAVYTFALGKLGVDIAGVHVSALPAIMKAQPVPGAHRPVVAMDTAPDNDFYKRFGRDNTVVRLRHG